jgi:hypothetical protein
MAYEHLRLQREAPVNPSLPRKFGRRFTQYRGASIGPGWHTISMLLFGRTGVDPLRWSGEQRVAERKCQATL